MHEDLLYLNEKFGNLVCSSKFMSKDMSALCYWCESRGLMQCKNCNRSFCKFCIKNGHLTDETKRVCFVCGCYELIEVVKDTNSCLRDREMCDMLKRYEELCSNDKLANSIHDLLINIDALGNEKFPRLFEVIKSNIISMLHDIQKVEAMVNQAVSEKRQEDIDKILMPLLKVVMKHHVFKRLGRPQHCFSDEIVSSDPNRMDLSIKQSEFDDYERMQRSPQHLADEEKLTSNFEIIDSNEDNLDYPSAFRLPNQKSNSLSLVSSQINKLNKIQLQFELERNNSPKIIEVIDDSPTKEKRKRSKRQSEIERRSVRLRSETTPTIPSFNALQSDLSEAMMTVMRSNDPPMKKSIEDKRGSPIKSISIKEEKVCELSNKSSSVSSIDSNNKADLSNLKKFTQITSRNKNSHLVSPAPIQYERPFVIKDTEKTELLDDDIKQPVPNKTWSWERTSPMTTQKYIIPAATNSLTKKNSLNGDLSKILSKTVIIPKSVLDSSNVVAPIRNRPRLSAVESISSLQSQMPIKRSSSPSRESDEPKKKRGRPRKYFDYASQMTSETSNVDSQEGEHRNSLELSDSKC